MPKSDNNYLTDLRAELALAEERYKLSDTEARRYLERYIKQIKRDIERFLR